MSSLLAKFREVTQGDRGDRDRGNRSPVVPVVQSAKMVNQSGPRPRDTDRVRNFPGLSLRIKGDRSRVEMISSGEKFKIVPISRSDAARLIVAVRKELRELEAKRNAIANTAEVGTEEAGKDDQRQPAEPVATISSNDSGTSIRLHFTGKPSDQVRETLRSNGWRWNRTHKYWYHENTPGNRLQAQMLSGGQCVEIGEKSPQIANAEAGRGDSVADELREYFGITAEALDRYRPEAVAVKISGRWAIDDINGKPWPVMFTTRRAAVAQAQRHLELMRDKFDNPTAYTDIVRVRAAKRLQRMEELQRHGLSEMEAGEQARREIPEYREQGSGEAEQPRPQKPKPTKSEKSVDCAAIAAKFRTKAESLAPKVEHLLRPMDSNPTAKRIGQYHSRRLDGERLARVQEAFERLADCWDQGIDAVPEGLRDYRKPTMDALSWLKKQTKHISNGYHGYLAETHEWAEVREPAERRIAEGLRALLDPKRQAEILKAKELQVKLDALRLSDIPGFFPTPKTLAAELVELASIGDGDHVLEPSAGIGSLAEAVIESGAKPGRLMLCEVRSSLCEVLRLKGIDGAEVRECDFLEQSPSEVIDRIVMNPPFESGQDAEHVRHAFKFLKDGGRLVAIVSAGLFFRQDKKATEFREWLEEVQGEVIEVDPRHYRSAEAFRQTGANCKIVVIEK